MIIRKATPNDAEALATQMLLAMEEIVYYFIGEKDPHKAKDFLLHFAGRQTNQYSYQNCWVAEMHGEVVATVNLCDGGQLSALRAPVLEHIRHHYHHNFQPEDETDEGEYYIDTVGVHPHHHGRGIGSRLLQFLIEEYVTKGGHTLGLLVDEDNPKAKRLYLKLGFAPVGKKVLFGKLLEHLQLKGEALPGMEKDKQLIKGRLVLWKFGPEHYKYMGWNLAADVEGCLSLVGLLEELQAADVSADKILAIEPATAPLVKAITGTKPYKTVRQLSLHYQKGVPQLWITEEREDALSISFGEREIELLQTALYRILKGEADFALGDASDSHLLYFWPLWEDK